MSKKATPIGENEENTSPVTEEEKNPAEEDQKQNGEEENKTGEEKTRSEEDKEREEQEKQEETAKKTAKKIKRSEKSVKTYQYFILRLLVFLLILWILLFKVVGFVQMPSTDMYPRLDAGDLILYYRLDKNIKPQDIVVIEKDTPDTKGEKRLWVCRVVAAPGDTVEITADQHLVINGNTMIESNIFSSTPAYQGYTTYPVTLGEGEYFVLSDARTNGTDSRVFGAVERSEITGTVITILRRSNL